MGLADAEGEGLPDSSKCKGPKVEACLARLRDSKEVSVARME